MFTRPADLDKLWRDIDCPPGELTVVMEPTRNVWIIVAAWFRRRGARVSVAMKKSPLVARWWSPLVASEKSPLFVSCRARL